MKQFLLALAATLLLSGCATIVGEPAQTVEVKSVPAGASFTIQDENGMAVAQGDHPHRVELEKSTHRYFGKKQYRLMLEMPGYVPITVPLRTRPNLWYLIGNIPLGGFPGWLGVDPFNGGMYLIDPLNPVPQLHPVGAR